MIPYTFFKDVEKRLNHILYSDTDSLFLHIPIKFNYENPKDSIEKVNKIAEDINNRILDHLNSYVLPKLGIDPKYNETFFKTEIIADSIFFLGVKKNYAYRLLVKEGNIIDKKPVKYTGLTSKSDMTKYTKNIINYSIENVMFDISLSPKEKKEKATKIIIDFRNKIYEDIKELNVSNIGQPKKWSTKTKNNEDTWQISAMRLYNTIMQDDVFKPMTGGVLVPIIITNPTDFVKKIADIRYLKDTYLQDTPLNKITFLAFPHFQFDKDKVKERMEFFNIKIDNDKIWEKICNTTIKDIMSLFDQYCNPLLQSKISEIK